MDARAEYEVLKCSRQVCQYRKVLLLSHRFSTVRLADYIVVIENGRILESGTHRALIQRRG
jgi:ATP-binding cassette subfamily B protein